MVVAVRDMEKGSARAQNRVIGYLKTPLWLPEEILGSAFAISIFWVYRLTMYPVFTLSCFLLNILVSIRDNNLTYYV